MDHLTAAIRDGAFDPAALSRRDNERVMTEFVKLKGIGRWSAEIYLLFAWGHPDVWPADDLGLQLAVRWLKGIVRPPRGAPRHLRAVTPAARRRRLPSLAVLPVPAEPVSDA